MSDAERTNPSGASTFVLPPDWTTGTISLKATIYPPADLLPSLLECTGVARQDNNSFTLSTIRFTPTGYLEIEEVSGASAYTSSGVFASVRNITPSDVGVPTGYAGAIDVSDIAGNTSVDSTMRGAAAATRLWDFANDRPEWFRNDEFDVHSDARVVGVYPRGAAIRSMTHYNNAGNILDDNEFLVEVVPDGGCPLTAVAHEIYHILGRQHADHSCGGDAEAAGGNEAWTDPHSYTGGIGLDRRDNSGGLCQYAILAPNNGGRPNATGTYTGSQFYDFISYCTGGSDSVAWTSPTGWNRVVDQFATGPAGAMTSGSVSTADARTASAIALGPATLVAASAVRQTIRVLVILDGNGGVGLLQLTPGASIEALSVSSPR